MLGSTITDRNQGFEGLTFRPDPSQPGGGVFYLTHQRAPAMVIGLVFDPAAPVRRLGADSVVSRWSLSYEDLTAITWAEPLGRLLVLADAKDRLLVIRPEDGAVESELPIPGRQQEGLTLDGSGALWIADDLDKSLLRIKDAVTRIQNQLQGAPEETAPAEGGAEDEAGKTKKKKDDLFGP
jgi:uncharacterized protein YjiK